MTKNENGMIDFNKILHDCAQEVFSVENIKPKIEKALQNSVDSAIKDQFEGYGGKINNTIKEAIEKSICVDLDLGMPAYNKIVAAMLKEKVEQSIFTYGKENLSTQIEGILDKPPAEINLSDLLDKFKKFVQSYREIEAYGKYTCIIEQSEHDGYYQVYLDVEQETEKYTCQYRFSVAEDNTVHSIKAGWGGHDIDTKKTCYISKYLNEFEKLLFNLYACKTKIIDDGDGDYSSTFEN